MRKVGPGAGAALAIALGAFAAGAEEKSEISITRQPGIGYMPTHVIEKERLIEKHAARLGIVNPKVSWVTFSGGGAQTDALLSGGVDVVNTGVGNLLLLWDRTRGGVKGIVATQALPVTLITRDPRIKALADYGPTDKIAVPTVRVSTQAILLEMACAKAFGPDQWAKLDANTVQLGHPDAAIALSNPHHEVRSHFSAPPFSYFERKTVPGARVVLQSEDIIGGPLTQAQFFTTTRFAEANPRFLQAIKAATMEALEIIRKDTRRAVEIYKEISKDSRRTDELLEVLEQPGMMEFNAAPQGTMKMAEHLSAIGTLKTRPRSWKDYYLPIAYDLNGN